MRVWRFLGWRKLHFGLFGGIFPPFYPFFVFSAWLSGFLSQAGCPVCGLKTSEPRLIGFKDFLDFLSIVLNNPVNPLIK